MWRDIVWKYRQYSVRSQQQTQLKEVIKSQVKVLIHSSWHVARHCLKVLSIFSTQPTANTTKRSFQITGKSLDSQLLMCGMTPCLKVQSIFSTQPTANTTTRSHQITGKSLDSQPLTLDAMQCLKIQSILSTVNSTHNQNSSSSHRYKSDTVITILKYI